MLSPLVKESKVRFLYYFICMLLARIIYLTLMRRISRLVRFPTDYTTYLYYGIMWAFLLIGLIDVRVSIRPRLVIFIIAALIIMAGSCLFYEYSRTYVCPPAFWQKILVFDCTTLMNSFLFIIIGAMLTDYALMMDCLHITARIAMFGAIAVDILTIIVLKNKKYDDMSYAYCVCFLTCILLFWFLEMHHPLDGILSAMGMLSVLLCGTRGPVICILVMLIIWSFLYQPQKKYRVIAITVFLFIVLLFYTGILANAAKSLSDWLTERDLPSFRILDMLQMDEISDDSGRGDIYGMITEGIYQRPLLGYGIGGDRMLTEHAYAHNIFLEFFAHFGIFFGLLFLGAIVYYLLRGVFDRDKNMGAVSVIFFAGGVARLVFSSSYILLPELYLILGMILNRPPITEADLPNRIGGVLLAQKQNLKDEEKTDETVVKDKTDTMRFAH